MKRREILRRVLAAGLCLCMCLGFVEAALPALASSGGVTQVWIYHQYLSQSDYEIDTELEPGESMVVEPIPLLDSAGNELESFSGFSVEMGDAAVTIDTSDPDAPKAAIRYESSTPLVILHVYYHYNVSHFSTDFSAGDVSNVLPDDQDVVVVDDTNLAEIQKIAGLEDVSVGSKVYNTAMGLHTEAYAEVAAQTSKNYSDLNTPLNDGRTFDVTLESWFAQNNPTDVGFILDASGSMAFLDDDVDKGVGVFSRGEREKDYDFAPTWIEYAGGGSDYSEVYEEVYQQYGEFVLLPQDAVNKLLNPSYTDNTSLAYNDYQYYVYDSRDTVRELVPLGYWDGNTGGTENPLEKNLVGLYQFDRSGSGEPNFLKNGAPDGGAAEITKDNDHHKTGSSADGVENAGAFQLYYSGDTKKGYPAAGAVVQLDATVSDPSAFTISFAVKTDGTGAINNSQPYTDNGPRAEDLMTITDASGNELYTILRGTKSTGGSQNHVRWQRDSEPTVNYVNLDGALSKANKNTWYVFTYVVSGNTVTAYVNGAPAGVTDTVDLGTGPLSFTLGGSDEFVSGPVLHIDEVYIYDRALTPGEVEDLQKVSTSTKTVFDAVGAGQYAHFDSTGADMLISDRDSVTLPSQSKLAGWYYVNSTGNYDNIMAAGSAKSLHFLGTVGNSTETYPTPPQTVDIPIGSDGKYITDENDRYIDWEKATPYNTHLYATIEDRKNNRNPIEGKEITGITPCQFYFARIADNSYDAYPYGDKGRVVLRCIFSPAKGVVEDAPVIVEQVGYHIQNKHKMLDNALNQFIQQLRTAAPGSRLSAVRFSSDSFKDHTNQLLMQNWTDSETAATGLMSLNRGQDTGGGHAKAGSYDTVEDAEGNSFDLYNYVMTGGTYAYTGLLAFQQQLASGVRDGAAKYIVLFTDGADDELKDLDDKITDPDNSNIQNTQAVKLANELKDTFTIFVVRLTSGTAVTNTSDAFLKAIASTGSDGKLLYFPASGTEGLASVFENDVMGKMPFGLHGYSVKQYIDPRFDLVGSWNYNENIIHLGAGGHIYRGNDTSSSTELTRAGFVTVEFNGMESRLHYDQDAGLYYLQWDDQTIPRSNVGSNNIYTWQCTMTLRAKEDFIGGGGLLAQGPGEKQNYIFDPDDKDASSGTDRAGRNANLLPSKGFPRIQLNVQPYSMATVPMVDVRYVGESTDPAAALKALFESAEGEIGDLDHIRRSSHDEPNELEPDGSGYYYEYVNQYIDQHPAEYADLDTFLAALLTAADGIELPYYFPPTVGGAQNGTIKYQWEAVTNGLSPTDKAEITDASPKQYKLTVTYTPDASYTTTVSDDDYKTPRYTVGSAPAPDPAEALHTTYVVGGELAVKVRARKEALETYMAGHDNKLVVTVAMKKDGEGSTEYPLTLTADDLTDLGTGEVELALTNEAFQDLAPGEYTLSLVSTAEQYFTHFSPASTGDYTPESFSEGYIPAGTALSGYIAPAGTTAGTNTVSFKLGDLGSAASIEDARTGLADTLAAWVDKKLEGHSGDDQAALNALDLDPSWAEQGGDFTLPAYLNARLGMGVGEVTISPPVAVTLKTSKTVANGENNNTMAGFDLTLTSTDTGAVESTGSVVIPPNSAGPAAVSLAPLTFEHPGTYTYTLAETNNGLDNFQYSTQTYTVEITATANGAAAVKVNGESVDYEADGSDAASHTYTYDLTTAGATFTNTYMILTPPTAAEVTFSAAKTLDGGTAGLTNGQFSFRLQGDGESRTVTNDADGKIAFGKVEYTEAGTYNYTLLEDAGSGNYEYDSSVYAVQVTVMEDTGSNQLVVSSVTVDGTSVSAGSDGTYPLAVFHNTTKAPDPAVAQAVIRGTKIFAGGNGRTDEFTFELTAGDYVPMSIALAADEPMATPDMGVLPADTPVPEATVAPEETEIPEATAVPEETAAPEATAAPEETAAPEATAVPEETAAPEATAVPEATEVPEPQVQPGLPEGPGFDGEAESFDLGQTASVRQAAEGDPVDESVPQGGEDMPDVPVESAPFETQPPVPDPSGADMPGDAGFDSPAWDGVPEATEAPTPDGAENDGGGEIMTIATGDIPMPGGASGAAGTTVTTTATGTGLFQFEPITFEEEGTYTYTLREQPGSASDIYYDTTEYTISYTVTEDAGVLSVGGPVINGGASGSILFLNATISKSGPIGEIAEGDNIDYTVSWANFARTAANVTVTDLFDPGVTVRKVEFQGAAPNSYTMNGNEYSWLYENRASGVTGTINIQVQVNEKAAEPWDYNTSGGTWTGGSEGVTESEPTVHNQARVMCQPIGGVALTKLTAPVTNTVGLTEDTGSLTISKTVSGTDTSGDFTFAVHVEGASGDHDGVIFDASGDATVTLKHNESVTINGLPVNARYTVTETGAADYSTNANGSNGKVASGTIPTGGTARAAFVNTKLPSAGMGALAVTKAVTGDGGDKTKEFNFTITVEADGEPYTGGDIVGGTYSFALQHNGSRTFELPANAKYTVTETDANTDGYTTTDSGNATGTITEGGMVNVTFTNDKPSSGGGGGEPGPGPGPGPSEPKMGNLAISKTVTGADGETDRYFHFTVTVPDAAGDHYGDVAFDESGSATLTVRHGQTVTISGLPADASYTVTEEEADTEGYTTTAVGAAGSIPAGGTATAAFTNEKPAPSGPVTPTDTPAPSDDPGVTASPAPTELPVVTSEPFGTPDPDATPGTGATPGPGATSEPFYSPVPGGSGDSGGPAAPPTGDDAPVLPWLALLLLCGACLAALVRKKRLF